MYRILFLLLFFPYITMAGDRTESFKTEFRWQYGSLFHMIETGSWAEVSKLESAHVKCGFGPGEDGKGCIKRVYGSNSSCVNKLLFALRQGCRIKNESNTLSCVSPPQWEDENIIILGSRASFSFNSVTQKIQIDSLICDGD